MDIRLSNRPISSLLCLPNLQTLNIKPHHDFCSKNFPDAENLLECYFKFDGDRDSRIDYGVEIAKMMKKMPKFERFHLDDFDISRINDILCAVIDYAVSQGKKVDITNILHKKLPKKLEVKRKDGYESKQILNIFLCSARYCVDALLITVNKFLKRNRIDHFLVISNIVK